MTMLMTETNALRDVVSAVQAEVITLAGQLPPDEQADTSAEPVALLLELIENIAMMAEVTGLLGLHQISAQVQQCLTQHCQDGALPVDMENILILWITGITSFLDSPEDDEVLKKLVECLPQDCRDGVRDTLSKDTDFCKAKISTKQQLDTETSSSDQSAQALLNSLNEDTEEQAETVLGLFAQELSSLTKELHLLAARLQTDSDAVDSYRQMVQTIHATSEGIALDGVSFICAFVLENLAELPIEPDLPITSNPLTVSDLSLSPTLTLFADWSELIDAHLLAPADDDLCLAIADYLENECWPKPLSYRAVRNLLEGLTKTVYLNDDSFPHRETEATDDDVALVIAEDVSPQLIDSFFMEAPTQAEEFTATVEAIIHGQDLQANTQAAQRIAHTLKGSANLIGIKGIANFSHHLEDVFEQLLKTEQQPHAELAHTMQEAADTIEVMIEAIQGLSAPPDNAKRILQDVLNWANRIDAGEEFTQTVGASVPSPDPVAVDTDKQNTDSAPRVANDKIESDVTEILRVPKSTIDTIFNIVGETAIAISQVQEQLKRVQSHSVDMKLQDAILQTRRIELESAVNISGLAKQQLQHTNNTSAEDTFDSLEMDVYDEHYSATHSFIEAVADNRQASHDVIDDVQALSGLIRNQQHLNRELQELVVTTRLVAIKSIAPRLQRAVRQAARATGKDVELVIIGGDLQLDGDILNRLPDPLMHMLRNAVDHGIESKDQRIEAGKAEIGKITLSFSQEGNTIAVSCADDGRGLDYKRIHQIGIERGAFTPEENVDNARLARHILHAGFSTRDEATQISGRGVGLDVVHDTILNLKGHMDIQDGDPCGTVVNLYLPLTMLTSHCVVVKAGSQRFAIPTISLSQILSPGLGEFSHIGGVLTYTLGNYVYAAGTLTSLLGEPENIDPDNYNRCTVVLAKLDDNLEAVIIDQALASSEIVVKSLGHYIKQFNGVSGIAQLGDGGVVPVLNIAELLTAKEKFKPVSTTNKPLPIAPLTSRRVLIVDDSLSVRSSLSQLVSDAGFEPVLARDGVEALNMVQKQAPDIVLTDLEMPRMTGLELTTHLRREPSTQGLPIVMITSRTMKKHRTQASDAGVSHYLTKPFSEDDLLQIIDAQLAS